MVQMANRHISPRLTKLISFSSREGFRQAYTRVRVDPERYLRHVQRAHRLPVQSWKEMVLLGPEIVNPIAFGTISGAAKFAGIEGMGLGLERAAIVCAGYGCARGDHDAAA